MARTYRKYASDHEARARRAAHKQQRRAERRSVQRTIHAELSQLGFFVGDELSRSRGASRTMTFNRAQTGRQS